MFRSAASKLAHNTIAPSLASTLGGNKDLRTLQDLITAEKAVLTNLQKLSADVTKSSDALREWGVSEGDPIKDILTASSVLLLYFADGLSTYASHEARIREHMKDIRTREEQLDELKRRRKALGAKAESADRKLSKMGPENKNFQAQSGLLAGMQQDMRDMDIDIMNQEAGLYDFKRQTVKSWMGHKFGGLQELAEKALTVGQYGKLVLGELPLMPTNPGAPRPTYQGHPRTEALVSQAQMALQAIVFSPEPNQTVTSLPIPSSQHVEGQQDPSRPLSMHMTGPEGNMGTFSQPMSPGQDHASLSRGPSLTTNFQGLPQVAHSPVADFGLAQYLSSDQQAGIPQPGQPGYNEQQQYQPPPGSPPSHEQQYQQFPSQQQYEQYPSQRPLFPHPSQYPESQDSTPTQPQINEFGAYNGAPGQYAPRTSSLTNVGASSPTEASSPRSRFGTFPAILKGARPKPGPAPAAALAPAPQLQDRPPSLDIQSGPGDDSFSSSIAQALGQQWTQGQAPPRQGPPVVAPHAEPAQQASSPPLPTVPGQEPASPTGHHPLDAPLSHETGVSHARSPAHEEEEDDDDAQLAYMSDPPPDVPVSPIRSHRRVTFNSQDQSNPSNGHHDTEEFSNQSLVNPHATQSPPSPIQSSASQAPSLPPGAAPPYSYTEQQHPDDEKSLNAAAAREVGREMDALMFRSPVQLHDPPAPQPQREPSPPQAQTPPDTQSQSYPQPPYGGRPGSTDTPSSPTYNLNREPQYVRERERSPSGPASPTGDDNHIPLPAPPAINFSSTSTPSGFSESTSPYRTPPEYPLGPSPQPGSLYAQPTQSGSASSFGGTGPRTISAAAFKRQVQARQGSIALSETNSPVTESVSPLSVKKRALPDSPRVSSAQYQYNHPSSVDVDPRVRSVSANPGGGDMRPMSQAGGPDDEYDYISAYVNNEGNGNGNGLR
ncbi:hypothetical protein ABKN59_006023 [Abortiporus biennis]